MCIGNYMFYIHVQKKYDEWVSEWVSEWVDEWMNKWNAIMIRKKANYKLDYYL